MLDQATANDDNARVERFHCHCVESFQIAEDVNDQPGISMRMEVHHVSEASVGQCRTENGYFIFGRPIIDWGFVIDALA